MSANINSTSANEAISNLKDTTQSTMAAARISLVAATASLIFLVALHVLSPEFDPSWRMVS
jgi:hypothetical protein